MHAPLAVDVARLGQLKLIAALDQGRDFNNALAVGDFAYLLAEVIPTPGDKRFRCKWDGPFPALAVTASTATLELPEHWQVASNTFHVDKLKSTSQGPALHPLLRGPGGFVIGPLRR